MPTHRTSEVVVLGCWLVACAPAGAQRVQSPEDDGAETETAVERDAAVEADEADAEGSESAPATASATVDDSDASEPVAAASEPEAAALPKVLHKRGSAKCGRDKGMGDDLKGFRLPGLDGKTLSDKSFGGRVLVVNFWGTWCKPCLEELPEFDRLYRHYRKHGVTLVAIATDEEKQGVEDFVRQHKLAAKVAFGGESYATQYGHSRFPFTFVVDPDGVIQGAYSGFRPECMGQLEADIREQVERANE